MVSRYFPCFLARFSFWEDGMCSCSRNRDYYDLCRAGRSSLLRWTRPMSSS
jgi:hypothetical protein